MSFIAAAIIGGVVGIGGGLIAANNAKGATAKSNDTQQKIADNANIYNQQMYNLSRGIDANGNPVNTTLPIGFTTSTGQPLEQDLMQQILGIGPAYAAANAPITLTGTTDQTGQYFKDNPDVATSLQAYLQQNGDTRAPAQWLSDHLAENPNSDWLPRLQSWVDQKNKTITSTNAPYGALQPGADARNSIINALLTGQTGADRMAMLDPIAAARARQGQAYTQAAGEATQKALDQQKALAALRGFTGNSSTDDLLRARIMASGATQAGQFNAAAAVTNAQERQQVSDQNIQLQMAGLSAPIQAVLQDAQAKQAGISNQYASLDAILARLKQFQTGSGSPATSVIPQVQPVTNTGMIAGSAISNIGQGLFNYSTYNSLMNKTPVTASPTPVEVTGSPGYGYA